MAKDQGGKGGGARKYGRNKVKCSKFVKTKNKRPIQRGSVTRKALAVRFPFIIESMDVRVPESRMRQQYKPMSPQPHVAMEFAYDGNHMRGEFKQREFKDLARENVQKLHPSLKDRVLNSHREQKAA